MKRFIFLQLLVLVLQNATAQPDTDIVSHLDGLFNSDNYQASPGIAITILRHGKPIVKKSYGMAIIEHQVPFTHQSAVRMEYSHTRSFLAVALAIMEQEGLLHFEDKVRKYFPQLPKWSETVTIQNLLDHSSGFDDEWGTLLLTQASMLNHLEKEQLLHLLYNQPSPQIEPGKGYMYCNSDYGLLRLIMEKASKQNLATYMEEKIFRPLHMNATLMNDDLEKIIPSLAQNYYGQNSFRRQDKIKISPASNYRIVTTTDDLEKWTIACNDKNSLVSKAFERLFKNARPIPVMKEKHFTFGIEMYDRKGHTVIQHNGVNRIVYIQSIPTLNLDIIALSNSENLLRKSQNILDFYIPYSTNETSEFEAVYSKPVVTVDPNLLKKYEGRYWTKNAYSYSSHLSHINYYDIKVEDNKLNFYHTPADFFNILPIGDNLFKDPDYPNYFKFYQIHPDSSKLLEAVNPDFIDSMERIIINPDYLISPYLKQFVGVYYSKHLDYYITMELNENNQLKIKRPTVTEKILIPYSKNQFIFKMESGINEGWNVLAKFRFNEKNKVTGLNLSHVRMINHEFIKIK